MNQKIIFQSAFTLIELLIVIGIIAILAVAVIVAINPGRQFMQDRDATRESHLNTLNNALISYSVDNIGALTDLEITDTLTEICNTNLETYNCTDLINLSLLVDENYINQLPIDPQGSVHETSDGIGYLIAKNPLILIAPNKETRFIGIGISQEYYEAALGLGFCTLNQHKNSYGYIDEDVVWCDDSLSLWTDTIETNVQWGCYGKLVGANSLVDGKTNIQSIIAYHDNVSNFDGNDYYNYSGYYLDIGCHNSNNGTVAAKVCDNLEYAGHNSWYLPARTELREDFGSSACSGWSLTGLEESPCELGEIWDSNFSPSIYWSSSESPGSPNLVSGYVDFSNGSTLNASKYNSYPIRCRLDI